MSSGLHELINVANFDFEFVDVVGRFFGEGDLGEIDDEVLVCVRETVFFTNRYVVGGRLWCWQLDIDANSVVKETIWTVDI